LSGSYYTDENIFFPLANTDDRLGNKEFVLGIVRNGKAKAYWTKAVKEEGTVEDSFEGATIVARYESDIDAVRLFEKKENGELERVNPFGTFWFSWAAVHPDTELYR